MRKVFCLILGGGLLAGLAAEPRFRADDGNLWRLADNPALGAVSGDALSAGVATQPEGGLALPWERGIRKFEVGTPLISFLYSTQDSGTDLALGSSVGPVEGFSFGYRSNTVTTPQTSWVTHNFGFLWRPWDLLSTAITIDDAFGAARSWGGGLALRPLAWFTDNPELLTLTADGTTDGRTLTGQRYGARFAWRGSDLRVWYEPGSAVPGFEMTVSWGPAETTVSPTLAGQAFRWSTGSPAGAGLGRQVLRIRDAGALTAAPRPDLRFWGGSKKGDLPGLVDLLDRASRDGSVSAVAFENPPVAGGLAADQSLRAAVERLKAAGKKVYVHADSYDDSLGFQGWISVADRVSVDPTGSLWLTASGSRRLYLKDFFDKIGVQFVNFAPWETKSANNTLSFSSMPDGERAMLHRFLTDRDDLATQALASGRGDHLRATAADLRSQGPYLVAQQALDRGLVDALETRTAFDEFLKTAQPNATVVDDLAPTRNREWGSPVARRTVAVVHLVGDIVLGPGQAGQSIGQDAADAIRALREDGSVSALVLRVDSPGGVVTPSAILSDEVKRTVAAGKPVVVVMGDLAASGGYYLSAPASRIIARPGTLTGSIGVTAALVTAPKALDLLGIKADGVEVAPSAGFGDWTRPLSEADGKKWNSMIEATYDRFLEVVAEGRHLDKAKLEPLARGQIYTGREALALGLVDELGGQEEARAWLEKTLGAKVAFVDVVPGENNPLGTLVGSLASSTLQTADSATLRLVHSLDKIAAPWTEAVAGVVARGGGPLVWTDPNVE
jgi:protease-4